MKASLLPILFCCLLTIACAQRDTEVHTPQSLTYTTEVVVSDLAIPWGMVFLPDESMLITEKSGELIHFKDGKKQLVQGVPEVFLNGQGGLLDIELHPEYKKNGWIYFSYSAPSADGESGNTSVMRARLENNRLVDKEELYRASPDSDLGYHFGSRLEFDTACNLYFSVGDRGNRDVNPQDITRDCGKVYRIKDDGSIPADNPFVGQPNAKVAIYSYGHRNPQGMVLNRQTGEIWVHEHGPRGGDEINIVRAGKNYGWPRITYGINYSGTKITDDTSLPGMEQPIHYWVPSIAPSGMAFVTSDRYPEWKGNLLVGSLVFAYLERLVLDGESVTYREKLFDGIGRVRNVRQGPDGYLYMAVEGEGILRIVAK
ncbi:MAG: PQQ-dependent sugar dehydrogenase [Bacteroidota bacterium]